MSDFGKHLRHYRLQTVAPRSDPPKPLTQEELAGLMDEIVPVHEKMISFWETGTRRISHRRRDLQICLINVLHECGGIQTLDEANELLRLGRYDVLSAAEGQQLDPAWIVVPPDRPQTVPPQAVYQPWWQSVYGWLDRFFRWSEADDHARMSWAGMVIWSLGVVNGRLTLDHFLTFFATFLLWITAVWLLVPALQWPLTPQPVLQQAVGRLLVGWFGLPLLLALLTKADSVEGNQQHPFTLLGLKFTGALVGFNLVVLLLLILAAGWYYLGLPPLLWGWRLALLLPLLLGHIAARRIPADRVKLYDGVLRVHPVDYSFLAMYLLTGLLLGVGLYWGYRFWANPAVGASFLLVVLGVALWERQKKRPLSPPLLIFLLGCAMPLTLAWLFLFVSPIDDLGITTPAAAMESGLAFAYVISLWVLWLTLQLRNPPVQNWQKAVGLFLLLLAALGLSLYLLVWALMPTWINLLGFVVVALRLIGWGYGRKNL